MENYRKISFDYYGVDTAAYFTGRGYAFDVVIFQTGVRLELMSDPSQYLMLERGMRGGLCMATKRYAKANNPQVPGYDPTKPISWILYVDANNLYGYAMSEPLPVGYFRYMPEAEWSICCLQPEKILAVDPAGMAYIFEVDVDYRDEPHDLQNDLPLAPEKFAIDVTLLS